MHKTHFLFLFQYSAQAHSKDSQSHENDATSDSHANATPLASAKFDIPDWLQQKKKPTTSKPELPVVVPPVGDIAQPEETLETQAKSVERPLQLFEGWRPLHYR